MKGVLEGPWSLYNSRDSHPNKGHDGNPNKGHDGNPNKGHLDA